MRTVWPLVGRSRELRRLEDLLGAGMSRGAVLAGPTGVGKTRLAFECLHRAEQRGFVSVRVTATRAGRRLPLGALAPLVPAMRYEDNAGADDRIDMLRRAAVSLTERAGDNRLFLLVDDIQLLDETSLMLIQHLVVSDSAFIMATLRTGEPASDSVVALWKNDLLERIELQGLDPESVHNLLQLVLDGPVDHAATYELCTRSEGNVLFLRELVIGARTDGSLLDDEGIWRLVGPLRPSERLVELIESRLGALAAAEWDLLEVVSFGEPLGRAELQILSDPSVAVELERKGLLAARNDGRRLQLELAHPLYGDVIRARVPLLRRQSIARSLAEVIEQVGARRREDTLRVATWRLAGGDAEPRTMLAAARTARWRYDFSLAEQLARAALDTGAGLDAALLSAQLLILQGRCRAAETELPNLASQAESDDQRGQIAITRIENLAFNLGRLDEALSVAAEAAAVIRDPQWRDEISARRCGILVGAEGPRAGVEASEAFLCRTDGRALIWASHSGAYALARVGRIQEAIDVTIRGYTAHLALTQPLDWYPWLHIVFRCEALAHSGRFHDAEQTALDRYQQGLSSHSVEEQAWFAWHLAKTVASRGHVKTAIRYGREAVALFRRLDRPQMEQWCLIYLVLALALSGDHRQAKDALESMEGLPLSTTYYMGVDELHARAWTEVAGGDLHRGRQIFEEAANLGERIGDLVGAAGALYSLVRMGKDKHAARRLAALTGHIEGDLAKAWAAHSDALIRNDPQSLENVSIVFETMGAHLLAAEAAKDAAASWHRENQPRRTAAAERRAHELARFCEGASTPALRTIVTQTGLTPAENETALLAASGRSNKEIANRLSVSVRTVESRLFHAFRKLGITKRSELPGALRTEPIR